MPRPNFTSDERYLISLVQSADSSSQSNPYMWSYIVSGLLLAGFAAYNESVLMLLAAFLVVCGFRIYEERFQSRWSPVWRSIIDKYEDALNDAALGDRNGSDA